VHRSSLAGNRAFGRINVVPGRLGLEVLKPSDSILMEFSLEDQGERYTQVFWARGIFRAHDLQCAPYSSVSVCYTEDCLGKVGIWGCFCGSSDRGSLHDLHMCFRKEQKMKDHLKRFLKVSRSRDS